MERQTQTIQRKADASLPFTVERRKDIPEAPLYVSANIRSLSGWGEAEGKTTRGVFPVPNREIALKVMDKVKDVLDGKRCNICDYALCIGTAKG